MINFKSAEFDLIEQERTPANELNRLARFNAASNLRDILATPGATSDQPQLLRVIGLIPEETGRLLQIEHASVFPELKRSWQASCDVEGYGNAALFSMARRLVPDRAKNERFRIIEALFTNNSLQARLELCLEEKEVNRRGEVLDFYGMSATIPILTDLPEPDEAPEDVFVKYGDCCATEHDGHEPATYSPWSAEVLGQPFTAAEVAGYHRILSEIINRGLIAEPDLMPASSGIQRI